MRTILFLCILFLAFGCNKNNKPAETKDNKSKQNKEISSNESTAKIIFYEFGSTTCIPCKQMKPVMEAIQKKYADQIEVVFIDEIKNPKNRNRLTSGLSQLRSLSTDKVMNYTGTKATIPKRKLINSFNQLD
mgnify:CR=1 FL=1